MTGGAIIFVLLPRLAVHTSTFPSNSFSINSSSSNSFSINSSSSIDTKSLSGKTAVIVGSVSEEVCAVGEAMLRRGARVIIACGKNERGDVAVQKVMIEVGSTGIDIPIVGVKTVDLAEMEDVVCGGRNRYREAAFSSC